MVALLATPPLAASGFGDLRLGGPRTEQLLLRADVVEAARSAESTREALGSARSASELDRRLAHALEAGVARQLASADRPTIYSLPLKLELADGSTVQVTLLDRSRSRRIRTLVRERREGETLNRVIEIPLDRTTALPTGALVVPLAEGKRLLALRVEVRH